MLVAEIFPAALSDRGLVAARRSREARWAGPLTKWWWRLASGDGPVTRATKPYGTRGERTRGHRVQPPRTHWGHECAARTQRIDGRSLDQSSTSGREGETTCRAPPYP